MLLSCSPGQWGSQPGVVYPLRLRPWMCMIVEYESERNSSDTKESRMDRNLIETYAAGAKKLVDAYAGLSHEQLHAYPILGTWSLHQIAIHMMDSDLIGADRMKRIASMERPLLCGYDETAFNRLPGIEQLDTQIACELFAHYRTMTATILRSLPEASFDRFGIHDEIGKVTLAEMVSKYIGHLEGHLVHVYRKRELLGVPVKV
jgi:hypothetical protein